MARQMGNSGRGPDDLDRAREAQGSSDMERGDDEGYGSLASGEGSKGGGANAADEVEDEAAETLLAEGELVGEWSDEEEDGGLLAGGESVGPWSDEDLDSGMRADSPAQGGTDERRPAGESGHRSGRR